MSNHQSSLLYTFFAEAPVQLFEWLHLMKPFAEKLPCRLQCLQTQDIVCLIDFIVVGGYSSGYKVVEWLHSAQGQLIRARLVHQTKDTLATAEGYLFSN